MMNRDDIDRIDEDFREKDKVISERTELIREYRNSLSAVMHYLASCWPDGYADKRFGSEPELVVARELLRRDD